MASRWSTATIMQPSPSHLAIRTPRSDATVRTMPRNVLSSRPGGIVTERSGVVRESGQVDEDERAGDTHVIRGYGLRTANERTTH